MSGHTYSRTLRLPSVILILGLCAVLGSGTAAESKSYKPAGKGNSGKSAAVQHKGNSQSGRYKPSSAPSARPSTSPAPAVRGTVTSGSRATSYRPTYPASGSSTYRNGESKTYRGPSKTYTGSTSTYRTTDRHAARTNPVKTGSDYRPPVRANTVRTGSDRPPVKYSPEPKRSSESAYYSQRSRSSTYNPPVSYRPTGGHDSAGATTYRHYEPPKSYKPPSYREGRYHYSSSLIRRPCHYGYWTFEYYPTFSRRSCYFYYGFFPYVQVTRIVVLSSYPDIVYVGNPIYVSGGYYLESARYAALDEALSDIRSAWIGGRFDLIERHVRDYDTIAVLLDGEYDYSVEGSDYLQMTYDAVEDLETVSFVWDNVRQRSDGTVTAFGTHRYRDASGYTKTVYVSYTLRKIGGEYYITEVGSSLSGQ